MTLDLWRIHFNTKESRSKLLYRGYRPTQTNVQIYDTNPYSAGTSNPFENVLNITVKGIRPSDKFDNPYLKIPWVANDNSVHSYALVSGTCFRVRVTLFYQ